jgi:hypothetical protein
MEPSGADRCRSETSIDRGQCNGPAVWSVTKLLQIGCLLIADGPSTLCPRAPLHH